MKFSLNLLTAIIETYAHRNMRDDDICAPHFEDDKLLSLIPCFTVMVSGPCVNTLQTPIAFRFLAVCDTVCDFDSRTI